MLKKAVTTLLLLLAAAITAVLSDRLRAVLALPAQGAALHAALLVAAAIAIALLLFLLETKHALALNWPWHRYWYLRELRWYYAKLAGEDAPALKAVLSRFGSLAGEAGIDITAAEERQDLVRFLCVRLLHPSDPARRYFVTGEAGSGKTLAMVALGYELARAGVRRLGLGRPIPVLVRLRDDPGGDGPLLDWARRVMRVHTRGRSGRVLADGLDRLIENGQIVLLLDAVDEVASNRRDAILTEIKELAKPAYHHMPVVLTGRTRYVQPADLGLGHLVPLEVQPLSDPSVDRIIASLGETGSADGATEKLSDKEVRTRFEEQGMLVADGLARNPFWLSRMVESGVLNGTRTEILDAATTKLLEREWDKWTAQRTWQRPLPVEEQLPLTKHALARLALAATEAGRVKQPLAEAYALLTSLLANEFHAPNLAPRDVIGLGRDAQLLAYGPRAASFEPPTVEFRHALLQEFLTALALKLQPERRPDAVIAACADDPRWWSILIMVDELLAPGMGFDGREEHEAFVRTIFGGGGPRRSTVAAALLRTLDDIWFKPLVDEIRADLARRIVSGPDPEIIAAASRLVRFAPDGLFKLLDQLAEAGEPEADAALMQLLDGIMRADLASVNAASLIGKMLALSHLGEKAIEVLVAIGGPVVPHLVATLRQDTILAPMRAAEALGQIGDQRAVEPLIALLATAEQGSVHWIAKALGQLGDPRAIRPLLSKMPKEMAIERFPIAEAIGRIGKPAIAELIELLNDFGTARYALPSLSAIGQPAVQPLIQALGHRNHSIRRGAAEALGNIGDENAVPALARAAGAGDPLLAMEAIEALGKIGGSSLDMLIEVLRKRKASNYRFIWAVNALGKAGAGAVERLMKAAEGQPWTLRQGAVEALGRIGDSRAFDLLCRRLREDDQAEVRGEAALALGKLSDRRAIKPLIEAWRSNGNFSVRLNALIGLAELGIDEVRISLLDMIENDFGDLEPEQRAGVQYYIAHHLVAMGEERAIAWCDRVSSEKEAEGTAESQKDAESLRRLVRTARQKADPAQPSGSPA